METNSLNYKQSKTVGKVRVDVKVRLSDDCRNGHNDFAITGTVYERQPNGRWTMTSGGCCHDEILKFYPKLRPFVDLHLCDAKGAPMYPDANGFYHLQKSGKEVVMRYLRVSEDEFGRISATASDQLCLKYLLYDMGIVARWEREAKAAITQLEALTGETFVDDSRQHQLVPLTPEEVVLIETRMAEGYYLPEAIERRRVEATEDKRRQKIRYLKEYATREIKKIETRLAVELHIIDCGLSTDNFIYYDHTNTGVFNWLRHSVNGDISREQYGAFMSRVDYSKLPAGIKFEIETHGK